MHSLQVAGRFRLWRLAVPGLALCRKQKRGGSRQPAYGPPARPLTLAYVCSTVTSLA
ncbi:MAG TPA: hypothetical protein VEW94_13570 [Chloroflexia bacterium]|nr:hypothetical protein [Chloroflexia bacterium]